MPAIVPSAREKLLDAAVALIRHDGFAATSLDDLCRKAGVTKGAFFAPAFAGKEELGVAAADHWSAPERVSSSRTPRITALPTRSNVSSPISISVERWCAAGCQSSHALVGRRRRR
jgi:AcrR family transcriptional regulator